jgi:peptidoglycan/LPS O-acetylase OafA/YrhL
MTPVPDHGHGAFEYRPALDGLRAVAVLAVIAYHLGYRWLPGGFIGVDIFFVLSGYLITTLLLTEWHRHGRIRLGQFWLRRAKRLLPALLLLLAVVAGWVAVTALPFELALRRRDLFWTMFYGANWHFIATGQDYFAQFVSASPLRHTWSLAIEEQFYLVWPLLVAATIALGRRRHTALATLCGLGIVASATSMAWLFDPGNQSRAYFGTDSRIHQPLIGALLALALSGGRPSGRQKLGGIVSIGSAVVLLGAFALLDDQNPAYYRGLSAGLALLATALVWGLEAAPSSPIARVLAWWPIRWTGQISYGLYLWHWPAILAVTTAPAALAALPGSTGVNLTRVLATFAVATASFYALERPVRHDHIPGIRSSVPRFLTATAGAAVVVLAMIAWSTKATPAADSALLEIPGCPSMKDGPCLRLWGAKDAPALAVIGDSTARSLDPAFMALSKAQGWTYVLAAQNACRITRLMTYVGQVRPTDRACYDDTPRLLDQVVSKWHATTIVVMDRWDIIDVIEPDGRVLVGGTPAHIAATEQALLDVSQRLTARGARLVFIELPPVLLPACSAPEKASAPDCRIEAARDAIHAPYNAIYQRVAARLPRVSTISITHDICPDGICTPMVAGMLLRFDGLHFTQPASLWLAPALGKRLSAAGVALRR